MRYLSPPDHGDPKAEHRVPKPDRDPREQRGEERGYQEFDRRIALSRQQVDEIERRRQRLPGDESRKEDPPPARRPLPSVAPLPLLRVLRPASVPALECRRHHVTAHGGRNGCEQRHLVGRLRFVAAGRPAGALETDALKRRIVRLSVPTADEDSPKRGERRRDGRRLLRGRIRGYRCISHGLPSQCSARGLGKSETRGVLENTPIGELPVADQPVECELDALWRVRPAGLGASARLYVRLRLSD